MIHHVDVHVRDLQTVAALFDALAVPLGYRRVPDEPGFVGYGPQTGGRPRFGFSLDPGHRAGTMQLAFGVESRDRVDDAARIAGERGARAIDGPSLCSEYGDDYYAVFFEDPDGNRYEIVADPAAFTSR